MEEIVDIVTEHGQSLHQASCELDATLELETAFLQKGPIIPEKLLYNRPGTRYNLMHTVA